MKPRRQGNRSGTAIVEFAIAFSLLFPVTIATFQIGRGILAYNELNNAVRAAARYAALQTYPYSSSSFAASWATPIKNAAVYGNPNGGTIPLVSGLTTSNINVSVVFANSVPARVVVQVNNYTLPFYLKTITINKPRATFQYQGRYAPEGT